ncbi:acetyl-CoA carboxylase, carboxyltransferase component (subunits alpha and beta) [Desulfosporosinus orientis DSM 765]|uniref:Acetyl-CoA carboxylase, carboxyltransferase component (Subunits alpha and beta) n=1 Tax=Desulfosporosinus orientis (strain ATCC 19365 / DSM 765 / NCIMB 8382 / VKM B-1628 / Singapore I) TaxID=768706 RepID=G7WCV8_DESOD|nr:carboxyl transferase domain-containing protein [Desulfosporosinus orientis]AET66864.1 acetyl-CoA carboxylase, carboxyltransferase component (subunits alpha and beta) [Desulfosporosinus orientis DSM 765]
MDRKQAALRPYFEKMPDIGKPLSAGEIKRTEENIKLVQEQEEIIAKAVEKVKNAGTPAEVIRKKGQMTVWDRLDYLVDEGTWCPLHTLYNPRDNEEGCTGVVDGLGKIEGKWAVIIGFDNKVMAGAWISGQAENMLRVTDLAKRLNIPLVWLTNCSGVKLMEQENVYADRRGSGATFFRHAELNRLGIPILNGIYGTNPAGGGYQGISPTILIAHKDANIAVGGAGIVGGMNPKGFFDLESAQQLIDATQGFKAKAPGRIETHFDETAYFREVYDSEIGVLDGIKEYMSGLPAYDPKVFRVAEPAEPKYPGLELNRLLPANQRRPYDAMQILARLTDNSEFMEYRPEYGPEVFTGIAKIDGFPVGIIGNRQGMLPKYPEYAERAYVGIGGKHYRQGLIKQSEFVTLCGRDNLPIIWLQDTTGIDVGDVAERAELLALGQSLIYSIEKTDIAMICIVLRKGTAAAHYIMGGPQANENNAFTLGTPLTEIYVMHGETAAAASYARRLVKEQEVGKDLEPVIEKMNQMVKDYEEKSRPAYCAKLGLVDEIVGLSDLRSYCVAFASANYQNPKSITPIHQMILPRTIKG